jgi:hypothetical protein
LNLNLEKPDDDIDDNNNIKNENIDNDTNSNNLYNYDRIMW